MTGQRVAAITVSYRTGWRLRDCLHVLAGDPEIDAIIIVDNGNNRQDSDWIHRFAGARPGVTVIQPGGNIGFAAGCNLGAGAANADWLVFINPDAMMKRGSVGALISAASGKSRPVMVGGRIFGINGREQRGARRRELSWSTATGLSRWTLEATPAPDGPVSMPVVSGAFFAIPHEDFDALGGFDEGYFLHVEDVDLCRRVREAGGEVIYQPVAGAMHAGATSDAPSAEIAAHKAASLKHYFRKFARSRRDRLANALLLVPLGWYVRARSR